MTKKGVLLTAKASLGACAAFVAVFMVWAAFWGDITVKRNEAQVVEIVNKQLERLASEENRNKNAALRNLNIKKVEIGLSNSIDITAEIEGRSVGQAFSTTLHTVGNPEYRPADKAFFFRASQFKVMAFAYKDAPVAEKLTGFVRRITKNEEANNLAAEFAPKLEALVTRWAESLVKDGLERFPVYRLKDDTKGWIVHAALKSVEVKNGEIVAVVSIWQLTWIVFGYFVLFLGICAAFVALLRHPEALNGLSVLADLA